MSSCLAFVLSISLGSGNHNTSALAACIFRSDAQPQFIIENSAFALKETVSRIFNIDNIYWNINLTSLCLWRIETRKDSFDLNKSMSNKSLTIFIQ